jgi:hypothetical protein
VGQILTRNHYKPSETASHLLRAWTELNTVFDAISADEKVRAVVLASSNPKMFTAGLDGEDERIYQLVYAGVESRVLFSEGTH